MKHINYNTVFNIAYITQYSTKHYIFYYSYSIMNYSGYNYSLQRIEVSHFRALGGLQIL